MTAGGRMSDTVSREPTYTPGRSQDEERRLIAQGELQAPATRFLFEAAGITRGMRVLDVGSGAGDVSFLVAELVGDDGHVVGIDLNPEIVSTATVRAGSWACSRSRSWPATSARLDSTKSSMRWSGA